MEVAKVHSLKIIKHCFCAAFIGKRPANHASHFGIEYENVHALTGKLMGTHNDRYGSVWS